MTVGCNQLLIVTQQGEAEHVAEVAGLFQQFLQTDWQMSLYAHLTEYG